MIRTQEEALLTRQSVDILEVSDTALRIACTQKAIEVGVARTRVPSVIPERSVDAQHRRCCQDLTQSAKEIAHRSPTHDVQCVGREEGVDVLDVPRQPTDIELQGREEISRIGDSLAGRSVRRVLVLEALAQSFEILAGVARLPDEVREMRGEVNGVLARSAADFEYLFAVGEGLRKDLSNRFLVTLAGLGYAVGHCLVKTRRARVATASTKSLS